MGLLAPSITIAALTASRPLAVGVAIGLFVVFLLLAALIWTRFGQARPVSKCVVLSLLAHLLLVLYAYSTHVLYGPPGRLTGRAVTIRLRDAVDWNEAATVAAPDPAPWNQAGEADGPIADASSLPSEAVSSSAPELLAAPPEEKTAAAPAEERSPAIESPAKETPAEVAEASPSDPKPLAEGLPSEIPQSQGQTPRLTDLLADDSPPAEPATLPAEPLSQSSADSPLAADSAPMQPPAMPLPDGGQFIAATNSATPRRLGDGESVPQPLQARIAADRLQAAAPFGATPQTEAAVAAALDWLAAAQSADGRWDADAHGAGREMRTHGHDREGAGARADTGVSGLALLAFLGAGETHLAGQHREVVQHGLEFLLASQAASGSLADNAEKFAAMYCHGMATLALSEAYALSGDERLLPGLKRALAYTIQSQHTGGGWRYQPYDAGDMSQFGWQLMALKSAELGGLSIPSATRARMTRFLQSCSLGRSRGLASYRPGDRASRTMTAEALVCRYFLAAENAPATLDEGAAFVLEDRPGGGQANYYYWYYATLAMFQRQGDDWRRWNAALQHVLLDRQRWDGTAAGSFDPDDLWGGYGGRVYSTALAALSLEVYYRYLPVHESLDTRLTDRPWPAALPR